MGRLDGVRAAVTGAAGFIGDAVARRLAAEGAHVLGLDVAPGADGRLRAANIEPVRCDVTDAAAVAAALAGCGLAVHAAALVREWGAMADFVRVNVGGTAAVLDAAAAAGVERVVQISSVVVYGYDASGEQDESAFPRACGIPYIDTKTASDRLARRRGAIVVRPGDVYGPRSVPWTIRPLALARSGRLVVPSDGGVMLPCYVDDLAEAIVGAAEHGEPGRAYSVWEGVPVSFEAYFGRIAELAGARPPRRLPRPLLAAIGLGYEAAARIAGRPPALSSRSPTFVSRRGTASIARAEAELGWTPAVPLDEGLRRSGEWARAVGLL